MEKVIHLFKLCRDGQIELDDLTHQICHWVENDPAFALEAINLLDSVQQQVPLPVTDYIELRTEVDRLALLYKKQGYPINAENDPDATRIFNPDDNASANPDDQTRTQEQPRHIDSEPVAGRQQEAPEPTSNREDQCLETTNADFEHTLARNPVATPLAESPAEPPADDATVIMPTKPHQHFDAGPPLSATEAASELQNTPAPEKSPLIEESVQPVAEDATVIAPAPGSPSTIPNSAPSNQGEPTNQKHNEQPKAFPLWPILMGGMTTAIAVILVVLWVILDKDPYQAVELQQPPAQPQPIDTPDSATTTTTQAAPTENEDPNSRPLDMPPPNTDAEPDITKEPSKPQKVETVQKPTTASPPSFSSPDDELSYWLDKLQKAADQNQLLPQDKKGTATYYLVKMLQVNPHSAAVSQARAYIAQVHVDLARKAREQNQWDKAQQHLDAAVEVRLPTSFLPESDH